MPTAIERSLQSEISPEWITRTIKLRNEFGDALRKEPQLKQILVNMFLTPIPGEQQQMIQDYIGFEHGEFLFRVKHKISEADEVLSVERSKLVKDEFESIKLQLTLDSRGLGSKGRIWASKYADGQYANLLPNTDKTEAIAREVLESLKR